MKNNGYVYLVGAGPGDIGLITVKGLECIKKADVIVYDRLANPRLLSYAKPDAKFIYVGKTPDHHTLKQEEINQVLVDEALKNKKIKGLEEYTIILREKTFRKSRFDFKIATEENKEYYLEVKGVTLEEDGYARFPDAPTERGARHLLELIEAKKQGYGAGAMFLIQLEAVNKFSPNDIRDKEFGEALRLAKENGVDIFAYNCIVTEDGIEINEPVEIILY